MKIQDALKKAMAENGYAVLGEAKIQPFLGRMPTITGGATYNTYNRFFRNVYCPMTTLSYDEIMSEDWEFQAIEKPIFTQTSQYKYPLAF